MGVKVDSVVATLSSTTEEGEWQGTVEGTILSVHEATGEFVVRLSIKIPNEFREKKDGHGTP